LHNRSQEKEKGNSNSGADQPINLSNQCTIWSQSIIEHIIDMLDEPTAAGDKNLSGCTYFVHMQGDRMSL
jgi:hypothetical protein